MRGWAPSAYLPSKGGLAACPIIPHRVGEPWREATSAFACLLPKLSRTLPWDWKALQSGITPRTSAVALSVPKDLRAFLRVSLVRRIPHSERTRPAEWNRIPGPCCPLEGYLLYNRWAAVVGRRPCIGRSGF